MKYAILVLIAMVSFGCNDNSKVEVPETVGSKVEAFDLQNGQYFLYVDNYHCNLNGNMVLSYKDSIYFQGDQLCQTGDVCSTNTKCIDAAEVKDLSIHADNLQLHAFGGDYLYGKDLAENGGTPNIQAERQIASIQGSSEQSNPSDKVFIYLLWCIAFGTLFYMHAPEY